ncbi:MAG: methyltransferase [Brevinematia bacterium]
MKDFFKIPPVSPKRIFGLRESSFANDLFISAVSHFDFFNFLDRNPSDIEGICNSLNIKKRPADVMLTLFKAYGFINEMDGVFYLSETSRQFLTKKSSFDLSSYVISLKDRPICEAIKNVLITGKPASWAVKKDGKEWSTAMEEEKFAESFTAAMNSRGAYLANGLLKALNLKSRKSLLDIGGASGIYSALLLSKYPGLKATVFEKPPVDKVATYSIKKLGLTGRMDVIAGDMFKDELPTGYDVHLISHVLHDWDINDVKVVIENSYRNLSHGGMIVIHDAHINRKKDGPLSVAEYSVLLMVLSEGKCYSVKEIEQILADTGFKKIRYMPTILNRSIITGVKV